MNKNQNRIPWRLTFWPRIVGKFIIFTFAVVGISAFLDVVVFGKMVTKESFVVYMILGILFSGVKMIREWDDDKPGLHLPSEPSRK